MNRSAALRCGSMETTSRRAGSESGAPTRFMVPMCVQSWRSRLPMDWRRADDSLPAGHRGECAVRLQQFLVAALLDDAAFGEDDDVVHRRERREPMGDANDGAMLGQRV